MVTAKANVELDWWNPATKSRWRSCTESDPSREDRADLFSRSLSALQNSSQHAARPSVRKAARRLEVISFHSRCAKWHSLGESSPTKERLTWATWDTASGWELLSAVVFLSLMMEADPRSVSCYKHCLNLGSSSDPRKAALHRAAPTARAAKGVSEGVMLHVPLCFGIITDICLAASKRYRAQKIKPGSS